MAQFAIFELMSNLLTQCLDCAVMPKNAHCGVVWSKRYEKSKCPQALSPKYFQVQKSQWRVIFVQKFWAHKAVQTLIDWSLLRDTFSLATRTFSKAEPLLSPSPEIGRARMSKKGNLCPSSHVIVHILLGRYRCAPYTAVLKNGCLHKVLASCRQSSCAWDLPFSSHTSTERQRIFYLSYSYSW